MSALAVTTTSKCRDDIVFLALLREHLIEWEFELHVVPKKQLSCRLDDCSLYRTIVVGLQLASIHALKSAFAHSASASFNGGVGGWL